MAILNDDDWRPFKSGSLLEHMILEADEAYRAGRPIMPDDEYDAMRKTLRERNSESRVFKDIRQAPKGFDHLADVPHHIPVGSLDKFTPEEAEAWIKKNLPNERWAVEPKFDGGNLTLEYERGLLRMAVSAGTGWEGKDVTRNARFIQGVLPWFDLGADDKTQADPNYLAEDVLIRGEVVLHRAEFQKLQERAMLLYQKEYNANRNTAISVMMAAETDPRLLEHLTFIAFHVWRKSPGGGWLRMPDRVQENSWLLMRGFTRVNNPVRWKQPNNDELRRVLRRTGAVGLFDAMPVFDVEDRLTNIYWDTPPTAKDLRAVLENWSERIDIPLDGLVVQPIDNTVTAEWGVRSDGATPRAAFSVKLPQAEQYGQWSRLDKTEWNLTVRGILFPRLWLETPLDFDGAQITHVTGNSYADMEKRGIGWGAEVKVIRSGGIISRIIAVEKRAEVDAPTHCYGCDTRLKLVGPHLTCPNEACPEVATIRIERFVDACGVKGFSYKTVRALADNGVLSMAALLKLDPRDAAKFSGFGESRSDLLRQLQERVESLSLSDLMYASGLFTSTSTSLGHTKLEPIVDAVGIDNCLNAPIKKVVELLLKARAAALREREEERQSKLAGEGKRRVGDKRRNKAITVKEVELTETALLFVACLPEYREFHDSIARYLGKLAPPKAKSGVFSGMRATWTRYRSAEEEKLWTDNGGSVGSLTKDNVVLFFGEPSSKTVKADRWREEGSKIKVIHKTKALQWIKDQL